MIETVIQQISLLQFKGAATRHEHFIRVKKLSYRKQTKLPSLGFILKK